MKIINFLICDDIRFEIGNKHSLIGVYDGKIIFNVLPDKQGQWPKNNKIGIFAKFQLESEKPYSFSLKVFYNKKEKEIGKGLLNIDHSKSNNKITLALLHNNFEFSELGEIEFQFEFFDKGNNQIKSLIPNSTLLVEEQLIK